MVKPNTQSTNSKEINLPFDFSRIQHPVFWVGLLTLAAVVIRSFIMGDLGQVGSDIDDAVRLAQIKDFLAGQSWFHTDQYRLGLAGGTDMHWSRLSDGPIILLTKFFDLFMSQDLALKWAYSVWPLMTASLFIFAMAKAARFWGGRKTLGFTLALLAFFVFNLNRFSPGNIDHHNIQIALVAIAMAFSLDPKMRGGSYAAAGFAAALSVAIGVDVYLFVAAISLFAAINWALRGIEARRAAQGFGMAMAAGLGLAFFGTIAPAEYGLIYCDALSLITVSAGVAGALGLAIAATLFSKRNRLWRFSALGGVGLVCLIILGVQAPQCLANPLDALPADVLSLWLDGINEAQPLLGGKNNLLYEVPYMIGAPLVALIVLLVSMFKSRIWSPKYLGLFLLVIAIGLAFYQIRFVHFAYIFALIPLAAWIGKTYEAGREAGGSNILYLACLAVSIPIMWGMPGILLANAEDVKKELAADEQSGACYSNDVIEHLNVLPIGVISAGSNGAGELLVKTRHRTLSGNYHRNWEGILTQIRIATLPPDQSFALLDEHKVDYVYYCAWGAATGAYSQNYENSLYANIKAGTPPDYLKLISDNLEGGGAKIFKVVR